MAYADTQWHLSKGVPISLIFALIIQFAGGVYFMSELRADVSYNSEKIEKLQEDVSALEDSVHDVDVQLGRIETNLTSMRSILEKIENTLVASPY